MALEKAMDRERVEGDNAGVMNRLVFALVPTAALMSFPMLILDRSIGGEFPFLLTVPWGAFAVAAWLGLVATERKTETVSANALPSPSSNAGFFVPNNRFACVLGCFFIIAILSAVCAKNRSASMAALWPLAVNLLLAYAVATSFDPRGNERLVKLWIATATILSIWAMIVHWRVPNSAAEPVATFGNRNFLAAFLAASVWVGTSLARNEGAAKRSRKNWIYGLWGLWTVLVIALACRSRGAMLALATVGGAILVMWIWRVVKTLLARFVLVAIAVLIVFIALDLAPIKSRLEKIFSEDVRPAIWLGSLGLISERPLVGHGWGSFESNLASHRPIHYWTIGRAAPITKHAHNEFLEIGAEGGLLAVAAFVALLVFVALEEMKANVRGNPFALGFGAALATWLVHNQLDVNLRHLPNQTLFWVMLGLIVAQNRADNVTRPLSARSGMPILTLLGAGAILLQAFVRPIWADLQVIRGARAVAQHNWQAAALAYHDVLEMDEHRLEIRYRLGIAQAQARQLDSAAATFEELDRRAPDYGEVNANLARIYLDQNQPHRAIERLRRAIKVNPHRLEYRQLLQAAEAMARPAKPR